MIKAITEFNSYLDPDDDRDFAEVILDFIESKGMLPPIIDVPAFGVKDNCWEPEDD